MYVLTSLSSTTGVALELFDELFEDFAQVKPLLVLTRLLEIWGTQPLAALPSRLVAMFIASNRVQLMPPIDGRLRLDSDIV